VDLAELRACFPVLSRFAYLNAGTDGPLPAHAVAAAREELEREANDGRSGAHFERRFALMASLREVYAERLSCARSDVALTTCTSEGVAGVIAGLARGADDETLTSDEEHPGLLGALSAARALRGVRVREVPLAEIARQITASTRAVACCHVGWMSGSLAPEDLSDAAHAAGTDVTVILDGAQGVGAVPVDVATLGCDAYAGSGQKWLCGPDGTGMLYIRPELRERLAVSRRGYGNLADPNSGVDARLHADARRFDTFSLSAETLTCALAAAGVLADAGWEAVHARARELAATLATRLAESGRAVAARGETTLVSFHSEDAAAERELLAERGVIVRNVPDRRLLRASVGAWNDERDLDRLLAALPAL
jgi:L-cysteine/cystine lyase